MNQIEKKVLKKITPTEEYRKKVNAVINDLEKKIKTEIKNKKIPADLALVGSIAKDTYLKNNMDIDLFICFPTNFKKNDIAKHARSIGKKILKNTEESYAEHPYIRGYYKEFFVEIVPCYKIENASQKLSAVDRTPLHTEFIIKNISKKQKDDVRLFKQFLKGIECYGAEAQIQGFSGYLCEIIVLYYNNFQQIIKKGSSWKKQIQLSLNKNPIPKFSTPLVFIDPVDPSRNVASAVVEEKFELLIKAAKEYNKKASLNFFFPNPIKPWPINKIKKEIHKQNAKYIGIRFDEPNIIDENLYPQIRKAEKSIVNASKRNGFKIYDSNFFIDEKNKKTYIIIKTDKKDLSKTKIHLGPPNDLKENVKSFKMKWKNNDRLVKFCIGKNDRINVEIKRKYRNIEDFLKYKISDFSLGKDIDKAIKKGKIILRENDLFKENLRIYWTEYLEDKMPWER